MTAVVISKACPRCRTAHARSAVSCACGFAFPSKACPECRSAVPEDAMQCACGYFFRAAPGPRAAPAEVVIVDFDMPFGSMVGFMVKWSIASIPAMVILLLVGLGASIVATLVLGAFGIARGR